VSPGRKDLDRIQCQLLGLKKNLSVKQGKRFTMELKIKEKYNAVDCMSI
jgi:hypothetical protein